MVLYKKGEKRDGSMAPNDYLPALADRILTWKPEEVTHQVESEETTKT